ncbi:hypothetical protein OSH04_00580 [Alcaligenes sp. A-TC2]|uniref:hypothetical protein n=1 Tax=Alcaligenes nematophilus TaxID=2994643 RepID=UPI0022534494|nr:hypothetical protein [Alcaligenes nematophilus]MCX5470200.1 hypothetical protein [Alcaligenes nematophilus]
MWIGNTWEVPDDDVLASWIAWVAIGQALHVAEILHAVNPQDTAPLGAVAKTDAIELLTQKGTDPWHRDGWMFQVMSWLAAHVNRPGALIALPHLIHAEKGFDGLEILLDESQDVVAIIIFEDKATENPRATIRDSVWPEFEKFELGHGMNRLTQQASGILAAAHHPNPTAAVNKISWNTTRRYRISITSSESTPTSRKALFKDYETKVLGRIDRRKAEVFAVDDVRVWMANLAAKAIIHVNSF